MIRSKADGRNDEKQRQFRTHLYKERTPIPEILKTPKISNSALHNYVTEETGKENVTDGVNPAI